MTIPTHCNQFTKKLAQNFCLAFTWPLMLLLSSFLFISSNIFSQTATNPEQGSNGSAISPHAVTFQNGNLHSGNAHFLEGHSIPYHLVMTGLTPGSQYIIKIGMDALESGAAAIDYVTSIHNLTPHEYFGHAAELINPLEGTGFTEASFGGAANIQTAALPAPVHSPPAVGINTYFGAGTWNNLAAVKKTITIFGASAVGNIWYDAGLFDYTLINTGNVTRPIYLTIHFTAGAANTPSNAPTSTSAVLAWGGHIASQLDYGLNTTAATEVNGAPYHTRRSGFWNGDSTVIYANEGADRSLQIDAIIVCVVTAGEIGGSQAVCSGGDPSLLTNVTSGTAIGALTYQWLSSATGCSGPWSPIGGATASTYDPPAGITATTYYKRVAYSDADCSDTSNCVTVTVINVSGGTGSADQTHCSPADPTTLSVTGSTCSGTPTYQWQSNTTSCADGSPWANIGSATGASFDPPAGLTTTTFYRRIVTCTVSGVQCKDTSTCITVTVINVSGGTGSADQAHCSPADPSTLSISGSTCSGTPTYQWQSNTTSCADGSPWANIGSATGASFDPPAGLTTTTYYRRIITCTVSGVQCKDTSTCITVTVINVSGGTGSADQAHCSPADPSTLSISGSTCSGTPTYQWQSNTTSCADGSPWANIGSATGASFDPPAGLTTTTYYRRIITCTVSGVQCKDTSTCITVTVNNVTAGTIAADQTICTGEDPAAFTETVAATGDGTPTYQWQSTLGSCSGTFANISGATSPTYDAPALAATTSYRRIVTFTLNGLVCKDTSNCVTVTVQDCLDHIFPTGTTCDNFEDQNVAPLLSLCFKEVDGVVTTANSPGAWFYYFYVTKPAGATKITVRVTQTNDNVIQGLFTTSEIKAWTSGTCNQITRNVTTSYADPTSPTITIDGLSNAEQTIVISVKYNSGSIVGSTVTGNSSVYTFGALYGTGNNAPTNPVAGSGETLTAENCDANTTITARDILPEEAPQSGLKITAFPNPYNSSVYFNFVSPVSGRASLEVFDVVGRRLALVFQGHIDAGIQKSVLYTIPSVNRVPMIYRLTVGDKISHGKLLPGGTE